MTWVLLPNLGRRFREFEQKPVADLSCFTCHGEDAERVDYKMPRGLPPLDPEHLPSRSSSNAQLARTVTFMEDEVVPLTRKMLGKPDVTCSTCHPHQGAP